MTERRKYFKKAAALVTAVQLDLDTPGFEYQKWGGTQRCKAGDWLVNNDGEVYTVDRESFALTYVAVSQGLYKKAAPVWAEVAEQSGAIETKEGATRYEAGAYIVYNDPHCKDGYAVQADAFEEMYSE